MAKKLPPPAWLVAYCQLHSFGKPYWDAEVGEIPEWSFKVASSVKCCYIQRWTIEQFLRSMEPYV